MPGIEVHVLKDRYRIEELIGRGGMAEVYKAWDIRRQYHVAIKVMREDLAEDIEFLRRFQREAQALAALSHVNIVRFYSFEREGPLAFIVMDYVEGTTLRRRILEAEGVPLRMDEVMPITQQVCSALHYAHAENVLHRDVKPGNIMIQPDGRVLVADFGIAKAADAATATTIMPGTPAYMSPEQCRSQPVDVRTDVYSLGIVVYEMLAGRRPFVGETTEAGTGGTREKIRWEQMHATPLSLRRLNPALSPRAEEMVLRALAKEPDRRWSSVLAFWRALAGALGAAVPEAKPKPAMTPRSVLVAPRAAVGTPPPQEPVVGYPHPPPPTGAPAHVPPRRHRRVQILAIVTLVLIVGTSALLGGPYFYLGLHRTNQTAKIVPHDTGALVTISPSLLQVMQLRNAEDKVAAAGLIAALPGVVELAEIVQSVLPVELDAKPDDVLPWIGREVGLAILYKEARASDVGRRLPDPTAPARGRAYDGPPIVLTAATHNQKKSDAFLADLRDQLEDEGFEFDEDTYRGVEVTESVEPDALPLAYATLNRLVVIATDLDTLRDAIDASLGRGRVLNDQDTYKQMLGELPTNRLGAIYLDWPSLLEYLDLEELDKMPLGGIAAIQHVGVGFALQEDGVLYDYVVRYDQGRLSPTQQEALRQGASPHGLPDVAPAQSMFYVSGQNLSLGLRGLEEAANEVVGEAYVDIVQSILPDSSPDSGDLALSEVLEEVIGIHLQDDLLSKMKKDYAWVIAPDPDGFMGDDEIPAGLLFLVQVTNQPQVAETLDTLMGKLRRELNFDIVQETIDGIGVSVVEDGWGNGLLYYGFVKDVLVIGSSETMVELLAEAQYQPLSRSEPFQGAVAPLPGDSRGYLFLDAEQIIRWGTRAMSGYEREYFEEIVEPYIQSVQALSMANTPMNEKGLMRGALFMRTETK